MSLTRDEVIRYLDGLSVTELSALLAALQERIGMPEILRVRDPYEHQTAGVPPPPRPLSEWEIERSIRLLDAGPDRIAVVKILRELRPIGLQEARQLVASAPVVLLEDVPGYHVREVVEKLEKAGARVELV